MEKTGIYTVRSGYHLAHSTHLVLATSHPSSSSTINPLLWKLVWSLKSLPKIKHFIWRAVSNFVATKANLFRRKLSKDPLCPLCHLFPETIEHLLLSCPWTLKTWFLHPLGYRPPLHQLTTLAKWFLHLSFPSSISLTTRCSTFTHISFLLWNIWKHRCHCVFNDAQPNSALVASLSFAASSEFLGLVSASSIPNANLHRPVRGFWFSCCG
ncbi:putative reverse transcriptase zinc-binding domain-containing protein [Rosa chinensis]|uniref:Putative reverse transcriptase zinc-binding domain-containing protein n=1 Tax=Rosa chinensis TaxID=74649 RepID=A0A2P6SA94_ROSCH|nr:putative reverse transcriptase zinc-binding domain-containing protein [Rosa chinensis]